MRKMYNSDDYQRRENVFDKLKNRTDSPETGKVGRGIKDLMSGYTENKKKVLVVIGTSILIGIMFSSWICQLFLKLFGKQDSIYVSHLFTAWANPFGIILAGIITVMCASMSYRFVKINKKEFYHDDEGNFEISTSNILGSAHFQTEKEREECFIRDKDIENITENILGKDEQGRLYALRTDLKSLNKNKVIFGIPGSGKSAAIIESDIIQCIRRGESAIVTDSKGDLYAKLGDMIREEGYIVKVLNVKSNELKNSDAFNLLKYLEDGDTSAAELMARCLIENTSHKSGYLDYFEINEMNGYKALLLYLSTNPTLKKMGKNTLAEMYNLCSQNTPDQLATLFSSLPKTHPARQAFNIFANCEKRIQGQILNGMGIKLSFLTDFNAQQVVSHDDIDLVLPMKEKCVYFVIIPDMDKTYNIIANLFFNMMFIKQCQYSDSLTKVEREEKQLCVNYILDEFKATGSISAFDDKAATVRSRKIALTIVLQSIGQLIDMYPGETYSTILATMPTKILMKGGDKETAQYFTDIIGKQTRLNKASRYSDTLAEAIHTHNSETITEGLQGVDLLPVDEALRLDNNKLIVHVLGYQPVKLLKYLNFENPYLQIPDEECVPPSLHVPKWREQMEADGTYGDGTGMNYIEANNDVIYDNPKKEETVNMNLQMTDNKPAATLSVKENFVKFETETNPEKDVQANAPQANARKSRFTRIQKDDF